MSLAESDFGKRFEKC